MTDIAKTLFAKCNIGLVEMAVMLMPRKEKAQGVYGPLYSPPGTCLQPVGLFAETEKEFNGFTEWQHSSYHPSLRVTQAYDVSVTLFMPLAAEHTFHHCSTSPPLVLPVYDDFLLRGASLLALFKQ